MAKHERSVVGLVVLTEFKNDLFQAVNIKPCITCTIVDLVGQFLLSFEVNVLIHEGDVCHDFFGLQTDKFK